MNNLISPNGHATQARVSHTQTISRLQVIDPDAWRPTKFNILLRVFDEEDVTAGGIIRPEADLDKTLFDKTFCVLVAAGEEAFTKANGEYWAEKPEIGDSVITSKYAGNMYRDENFNLYRHAHDADVCFVIKETN